jgi:hypothetical protein
MAQECMGLFEKRKMPQTADIEQVRIDLISYDVLFLKPIL